jgi:hypothetical protein
MFTTDGRIKACSNENGRSPSPAHRTRLSVAQRAAGVFVFAVKVSQGGSKVHPALDHTLCPQRRDLIGRQPEPAAIDLGVVLADARARPGRRFGEAVQAQW